MGSWEETHGNELKTSARVKLADELQRVARLEPHERRMLLRACIDAELRRARQAWAGGHHRADWIEAHGRRVKIEADALYLLLADLGRAMDGGQ